MDRVLLFFLFTILVITPLPPMVTETKPNTQTNAPIDDIPDGLVQKTMPPESQSDGSFNLDMMIFAETASSHDGIYYVCRRGIDAVAYFGASKVKYISGGTTFALKFPGSNFVIPHGELPTGSTTNYLYGNNPSKWKTGIRDWHILRYSEIYPGIDLIYKIQDNDLKYEFVVSPYADPSLIQLEYVDADSVRINQDDLEISKGEWKLIDSQLTVFQSPDGFEEVDCSFSIADAAKVKFSLDTYDHSKALIIDPLVLTYSTYLGGFDNDYGRAIAIEDGFIYVTGYTWSSNFPTANAYNSTHGGNYDCFVTKLAADGQSLIFSTFLGGSDAEHANALAVEDGLAFVGGETKSSNFPTVNAYNSTHGGNYDCFVTKLAADGQSLIFSTFLGGSDREETFGLAVDGGFCYLTGDTWSPNYPTVNAFDSTYNGGTSDVFVTKLAADGQSLIYSTFLGGSGYEYGLDIVVYEECAFLTGGTDSTDFPTVNAFDSTHNNNMDCFVSKFASDGQSLIYSTFLGGSSLDVSYGIAVHSGRAYVTGKTRSSGFPTVNAYDSTFNGDYDCFVTELESDGQSLICSTFLGGSRDDLAFSIAVEDGFTYVTGETKSSDFPTTNAYDATYNDDGTYGDVFLTKLSTDCQGLIYSTFLGGIYSEEGESIAVDDNVVYLAGETSSPGFPTVDAYNSTHGGGIDCFVSIFTVPDSDGDGLSDLEELYYGTDSSCVDTDNDNFLDAYELAYGTNATDPSDYPAMPLAWYNEIYEDLDGNATLIQNLIEWSDGNATLLENVKQQLDENVTLLQQVISWLDGNHTAIETLYTYLEGNATLLMQTIDNLNGNATLIDNLMTWSEGNATLLQIVISQLESNATLLQQTISWLDGNHTAIENLYDYVQGNATLLMRTVSNLQGNSTLIQNLIEWSEGNSTLIQALLQSHNSNATLLQQVVSWLDGNHTTIQTLLTFVEGNATLLQQTVEALGENEQQLDLVAALATNNQEWLQTLNSTAIGNITEIREVLDELGVTVGDTDYDGLDDLAEINHGTDIRCSDTDCDNLSDAFEIKIGTDPLDDDSDGDTYLDGLEIIAGTDPLDANDYPGAPTTTETTTETTSTTSTNKPDGSSAMLLVAAIGGVAIAAVVVMVYILRRRLSSS